MKFLCDVHIPISLSKHLELLGYSSVHVNYILHKWNSTDIEIIEFADKEDRVLITKDEDFRNSFLLKNRPRKLIKINLGNISTTSLIELFTRNIGTISELDNDSIFMLEIDEKSIHLIRL